jgi:hypothetical protein
MTAIVIAIFIVWFGFTILGQINSKALTWAKAHDPLSLIPRWTFFAPRPGTSDYHLVFQLYSAEKEFPWHEEELSDRRTLRGSVWNPLKRNKKALSDAVRSLARISKALDGEELWQIQYSVPYIASLSFLSRLPHPFSATHIRFMILESEGFFTVREPQLLFLSAKHALQR